MRSILDYGCLAYKSASQAIRTCTEAFKTSPISALQVEVSDMLLRIRTDQIMAAYWVSFEGHGALHPTKATLQELGT